jgi:hypothetical protein
MNWILKHLFQIMDFFTDKASTKVLIYSGPANLLTIFQLHYDKVRKIGSLQSNISQKILSPLKLVYLNNEVMRCSKWHIWALFIGFYSKICKRNIVWANAKWFLLKNTNHCIWLYSFQLDQNNNTFGKT